MAHPGSAFVFTHVYIFYAVMYVSHLKFMAMIHSSNVTLKMLFGVCLIAYVYLKFNFT